MLPTSFSHGNFPRTAGRLALVLAPLLVAAMVTMEAPAALAGGHPIPEMDAKGPDDSFDMGTRLMTSGKRMKVQLTVPGEGIVSLAKFNGTFFYSPDNPEATTGTLLFRADQVQKLKGKLSGQLTEALEFEAHPFFAFQSHSASKTDDGIDLEGKLIVKDHQADVVLRLISPGPLAESRDERWIKFKGAMTADAAKLGLESVGAKLEFDFDFFLFNYTVATAKATGINTRALDKQPPRLPSSPDALSNAGWYLMLNERYAEAIEAFDLALDKNPDGVNTYLRRGDAYVFNGDYGKAVGTYRTIGSFFMPTHPHILELTKVLDGEYLTPATLNSANQKWAKLQQR